MQICNVFKTASSVGDHVDGGAHAAVSASADSVLLRALLLPLHAAAAHALSVAVLAAAGLSDAL